MLSLFHSCCSGPKKPGEICVIIRFYIKRDYASLVRNDWLRKGGMDPPWSQAAQEASLSSHHPSWKPLLISKCHKFHSPLSPGALTMGGEGRREKKSRGGRWSSLSLFFFFLRGKIDVGSSLSSICSELNPFDRFKSFSSTWNGSTGRNKQVVNSPRPHYVLIFDTLSADILLSVICWAWHNQKSHYMVLLCRPKLTTVNAAALNWSIIPVFPLPPGTAYELMRCQQRCHVFIHSISLSNNKKRKTQRN